MEPFNLKLTKRCRTNLSGTETFAIMCVLTAVFSVFSRLGVDPHHDGMVVQPAFLVASGKVVHRDVFEQYGPVSAWIQGLFVLIGGKSLLVIKVGTSGLLAIGIALFFSVWRDWRGRLLAYASLTVILLTAYFFTPNLEMRAWSSDILVFLQGLTLWVGTRAWKLRSPRLWIIVGIVSTLCIFTRLLPGLALVGTLVVLITWRRRGELTSYIKGVLVTIITVLTYFKLVGGLDEWWYQTIEMPFAWSTGTAAPSWFEFFKQCISARLLPALAGPIAGLALLGGSWKKYRGGVKISTVLAISTVTVFIWDWRTYVGFLDRVDLPWMISAMALCAVPIQIYAMRRKGHNSNIDILAVFLGASALAQIYPVVEARHLWWSMIPLTGPAISILFAISVSSYINRIAIVALVISMSTSTFVNIGDILNVPRVKISGNHVLAGMYFERNLFEYYRDNIEVVSIYLRDHPDAPFINMCADGLWASLPNNLEMPDSYYVLWGFKPGKIDFAQRELWAKSKRPIVWFCPPSPDATAQGGIFGMRVIPMSDRVSRLEHNNEWPYMSVVAVPTEWPISAGARG